VSLKTPFEGQNWMFATIHHEPEFLDDEGLLKGQSFSLKRLVASCLQKNPDGRPSASRAKEDSWFRMRGPSMFDLMTEQASIYQPVSHPETLTTGGPGLFTGFMATHVPRKESSSKASITGGNGMFSGFTPTYDPRSKSSKSSVNRDLPPRSTSWSRAGRGLFTRVWKCLPSSGSLK
ncbi:unnamed protein product, partial [Polarella glacialis]